MNIGVAIATLNILFTPTGDFYRACDAFTSNNPATKVLCARVIENPQSPKRYVHLADMMWYEAAQWREGDLADIGRDMQRNGRGLQDARVNKPLEQQIIDKLDRLIDQLEHPPKDEQAAQGTEQPRNESTPSSDQAGTGRVDEVKLKKLAAEWGSLPPAERAKAIQELTGTLPPKWSGMMEDYMRSINRGR